MNQNNNINEIIVKLKKNHMNNKNDLTCLNTKPKEKQKKKSFTSDNIDYHIQLLRLITASLVLVIRNTHKT
jgi:hypothetical protein